ncbi:ABC transporter ATP-binding protein [Clostridium oryzae]|uniref:Putative ABC transporter ATP-binding protein YxlF n=1 Tax=Clostridium oryzae TaxID=1450648 RepID=A0A1V4IJD2_9CLOT|nr:ATP-binding cassette domain-containing protein [Clostridium oryzae]OPJ60019.1 putative ABC transporter ATP-binding protein YxlF [Clostridium oryzae]
MDSIILEAHGLTKVYNKTVALDHINLKIGKGKIYGFIGQNGAGKTTFLRLITGLAFPTEGKLALWGESGSVELQMQRKRIGCMIETPALYPNLSAYQNMEVQRIQRGIPDKAIIEKCLHSVGLKGTGRKAVRNFSLGMRQRLGIAIALLNTPEFLILDEPINGLDPTGIVEIRNLLKSLNKEYGMTILVSSHILEELYQTASQFILLDRGKVIEELSARELDEHCKKHIAIKTQNPEKALLVLEDKLNTENIQLMPDGMLRLYEHLDEVERVAQILSGANILVTGLNISGDTLEDYFLSKVGGTSHE